MKSLNSLIANATRTAMQQDHRFKQVISQIVPARTLAHIEFCRLEGGRLRVTVDSAAWIAKIRFSERQIIGALKQESLDIHTLSFHVAPAEKPVARTTLRKPNDTSERSASAIQNLADTGLVESQQASSGLPDTGKGRRVRSADALASSQSSIRESGDDKLRQELLKLAAKLREPQKPQ